MPIIKPVAFLQLQRVFAFSKLLQILIGRLNKSALISVSQLCARVYIT